MNMVKTAILLAGLTALFGWAGWAIGGESGMVIALGFAALTNIGSYWFSDKIVLRMYGAREINSGPVYDQTRALAAAADLPMPRVYIIDNPQPNAFATGRNPQNAAVAVNTGLLSILTPRELSGVIAHELAHIKNRDTLTMTVTATIAGAISMLAHFGLFFGGHNNNRQGNAIATLLVMILAPLAAMLVQMAISRTREYSADRIGAEICGDPLALAGALEKLQQSARRVPNLAAENNPATAHMFIINPLHTHKVDNLFSTHPNTANRVAALRQMAQYMSASPDRAPASPWI